MEAPLEQQWMHQENEKACLLMIDPLPVELVAVDVGVVGVREAVGEEPVAAQAREEEQHQDREDEHEVRHHAQHLVGNTHMTPHKCLYFLSPPLSFPIDLLWTSYGLAPLACLRDQPDFVSVADD